MAKNVEPKAIRAATQIARRFYDTAYFLETYREWIGALARIIQKEYAEEPDVE